MQIISGSLHYILIYINKLNLKRGKNAEKSYNCISNQSTNKKTYVTHKCSIQHCPHFHHIQRRTLDSESIHYESCIKRKVYEGRGESTPPPSEPEMRKERETSGRLVVVAARLGHAAPTINLSGELANSYKALDKYIIQRF